MNRGSALKWIELLKSGSYEFNDGVVLRDGNNCFSLAGVLEDFVTGEWTLLTHAHAYATPEKSICFISENTKKKCKIKSDFDQIYKLQDYSIIRQHSNYFYSCIGWIEENYESL